MKQKRQGTIGLFLCLTFFIALMFNPVTFGNGGPYFAPYREGGGPNIDGTITTTEWIHSSNHTITFSFNGTENQKIQVTLYLLHNGSAIFIGLNITQGANHTDPKDAFYIYFDENHNGVLNGNTTNPNEDGAKLTRDGNFTNLCYNGTWVDQGTIVNSTKGSDKGATNGVGYWEFAFISTYDPVKRQAKQGLGFDVNLPSNALELEVTIGLDIEYYDANLSQTDSYITTFNRTEKTNPAVWYELICGRVPFPEPNLLAIWAFITLAMIVPAVLVGYLTIWIIRRKKY